MMQYKFILLALLLWTAAPAAAQKSKKAKKANPENVSVRPTALGKVNADAIDEASGLASSTTLRGYYWTHNDSGGKPEVYLLDSLAKLVSVVHLKGAFNRDWEDIAEGPGPVKGRRYVYVGDIGNNSKLDIDMQVYRFEEPVAVPGHHAGINADVLNIRYPDGPRDAESLMVDPISRNIYIVSKREKQVGLYRAARLDFKNGDKITLEKLITLPCSWVTAVDISKDGHHIVLKTYANIYYWHRRSGESVEAAMSRPAQLLPYIPEKQGEGVTFKADNSGYITISEGKHAPLYFYPHRFK